MKLKIIFIPFIFIFVLSGCYIDFPSDSDDIEQDSNIVKIGVIISMSEEMVSFGLTILDIMNVSINDINENGGVNGKLLELVVRDGRCSDKWANLAAKDLFENEHVNIIIGGICSDAALGASSYTEQKNIIMFSPTATSSEFSNAGDFSFRSVSSNKEAAFILAEKAYLDGNRKVGSISQLSSVSSSFRRFFVERFEELGGEIVSIQSFVESGGDDYSDLLIKIKEANPDSLLILTQSELVLSNIFSQVNEFDLNYPIYGYNNFGMKNFYEGAEGKLDNIVYVDFKVDDKTFKAKNLIRNLQLNLGYEVYGRLPFGYIASAYDLPHILKKSLEGCSFEDTFCIRDNLYMIYDFEGVLGSVTFDENGDSNLGYALFTFEDDEPVLIDSNE